MAKSKEREEKICLNCGAALHGLHCHECGQKNVEPRRPIWEIPWAFVEDIINVDGKFFKSVKRLLFYPGFLSREYIKGKRNSYNDPVKIYLVTSFIFFVVSTFAFRELKHEIDTKLANGDISGLEIDTTRKEEGFYFTTKDERAINDRSTTAQDTTQLRAKVRETAKILETWADDTRSNLPYLFWISLPMFALALKLLYIRRKIFYWDHLIFSLGVYSFNFLWLSISFSFFYLLKWIFRPSNEMLLNNSVSLITFIAGAVYIFFALKFFYGQGYLKTLVKFLLLNILSGIVILVELVIFLMFITNSISGG